MTLHTTHQLLLTQFWIFIGPKFFFGEKFVQEGPRTLPFKLGPNRASNSWDIADIEFSGGWVGGGGGGGVKSFFRKTQT